MFTNDQIISLFNDVCPVIDELEIKVLFNNYVTGEFEAIAQYDNKRSVQQYRIHFINGKLTSNYVFDGVYGLLQDGFKQVKYETIYDVVDRYGKPHVIKEGKTHQVKFERLF